MQVIGLQIDSVWENKAANHDKVLSLLDRAKPSAGALVVLPEMFATGFSMNVAAIHDETRETQDFLSRTAAQFKIYLMGGLVMKDEKTGRGRNEAVVYSPEGREVARYCKLQPFTLGGESECYVARVCARRKPDNRHRQLAGQTRRSLAIAAQGAGHRESGIRRRSQPLRPGPETLSFRAEHNL
jgi:hypothetical protein